MPSFEEILEHQTDEVKPVPLLPQGTYNAVVQGLPERVTSKTGNVGFRFNLLLVAAEDDVDEEELSKFDGQVAGSKVRYEIWMTENPLYFENNLKSFIEHCGIDPRGKSHTANLDETPNSQIRVFLKHEPSQDGQRMFARVGRTLPAED